MPAISRVMVVDDSPDDRSHVKSALLSGSTSRFQFLEASTCADALKIFHDAQPGSLSCMILDFDLPDGLATDILEGLPRFEGIVDVPVLVLTGSSADRNKVVLRAGAHEYLGKGWMTASSITRAVENAIDRHATARQLAESHARIRASEAFARGILDSSPDCVKVLNDAGDLVHINPIGLDLLELDAFEPIRGKAWAGIWPNETRHLAEGALAEAATGKIGRFQGFCPTAKGTPKYWDVIVTTVRNESGAAQFLAVSRDITSLRRSEELVRESERRFRSIADSSPVIMCVLEPDGNCSYLNRKWSELTGQPEAQWSGDGWLNAVHIEDRIEAARSLKDAAQSRTEFTIRFRLVDQRGLVKWMLLTGTPRSANGLFLGFVGSATDITDQKDLEQIVAERTAKLRQTIGELESVSYSISHDMRQPLRSMQQFSQILLEDYGPALDATAQDHLKRIVSASVRLDRLIQDVLTLGRVSKLGEQLKNVDVRRLTEDIVAQYSLFQPGQVDLQFTTEILPMLGHEALLGQIISNLLGNAVKFKSPDRPLAIKMSTEKRGEFVRLSIEDNGIGIASENYDRIWKIFERVPGALETEGTGIGLAIVKRAAERMGGTVGVNSEAGQGSRFWIELPPATSQNL